MHLKEPNIIEFKTRKGNQYIYDACSNKIFFAPKPILEVLKHYATNSKADILLKFKNRYDKQKILFAYERIKKWIKQYNSFFYYKQIPPKFSFNEKKYWDEISNVQGFQLILNATEDCNFRCKYCAYSGEYYYKRAHAKKYMSFNVARRSVDYFLTNFIDVKKLNYLPKRVAIGFYGGEPLLNFDLIKKVVHYTNSKYKQFVKYDLHYNITTNGSLLSKEILDFLVDNNVSLAISLDGPKKEHNRNRIFKSGRGTFDLIIKNIYNIKIKYPNYYNNIMLFSCYDLASNLLSIQEYFDNTENNLPRLGRSNLIEMNNTYYFKRFSKEDFKNFNMYQKELKDRFFKEACNSYNNVSNFLKNNFGQLITTNFDRKFNRVFNHYTGACLPGKKIFVDVNGNFHICEKMNENFPIGDCYKGIDYLKVEHVMHKYYKQIILRNNCNICVARNFCSVCFANSHNDKDFKSPEYCVKMYDIIKSDLEYCYSIGEENRNILYESISNSSLLDII